ncbi:MAG: ComF family protein [Bdellovibrionales bacterium]
MAFLAKNTALRALDLLLPPLCLICDDPVSDTTTLCPACWKKIQFIGTPFCACCGTPFDFPVSEGTLCGACLTEAPHFEAARAAMLYDDASRALILGFKHADRTYAAKALAPSMVRAGGDFLERADALLPVPLHRWRLFHRRYNQSALLAQQVGLLTGKPVLHDTLRRTRTTVSQGHLKRKERQENVKGAFAVAAKHTHNVKGKTLVLIDDVLTTGSTVNECARVLLGAGAKQVYVLTLARVKSFV